MDEDIKGKCTDNRNLFTLAFINSFNMYPVFSTSLFLLILGTSIGVAVGVGIIYGSLLISIGRIILD